MIRIVSALAALSLAAAPAIAEDAAPSAEEGFSLLEEGAKIILRSFMDEAEPALRDMHREFGEAVEGMGPALQRLAEMIGDIRNYEPPVMLPNGDILIRRKPSPDRPVPGPNGEIEI